MINCKSRKIRETYVLPAPTDALQGWIFVNSGATARAFCVANFDMVSANIQLLNN